jgi:hypothetical protein
LEFNNTVAFLTSTILILSVYFFPFFNSSNTDLWPLKNIINMFIAITVSRVLVLSNFSTICLALFGLVFYDVFFVIASQQLNNNNNNDGGVSIMEAIANSKIAQNLATTTTTTNNGVNNDIINNIIMNNKNIIGMDNLKIQTNFEYFYSNLINILLNFKENFLKIISNILNNYNNFSWRPGFFVVELNNKVTDGLGLGDVIFPSLLATFSLKFDLFKKNGNDFIINSKIDDDKNDKNLKSLVTNNILKEKNQFNNINKINFNSNLIINNKLNSNNIKNINNNKVYKSSLFAVTIFGYLLGCFFCEVFQTGNGQPALLFIVPSMLLMMVLSGFINKNLKDIFEFDYLKYYD